MKHTLVLSVTQAVIFVMICVATSCSWLNSCQHEWNVFQGCVCGKWLLGLTGWWRCVGWIAGDAGRRCTRPHVVSPHSDCRQNNSGSVSAPDSAQPVHVRHQLQWYNCHTRLSQMQTLQVRKNRDTTVCSCTHSKSSAVYKCVLRMVDLGLCWKITKLYRTYVHYISWQGVCKFSIWLTYIFSYRYILSTSQADLTWQVHTINVKRRMTGDLNVCRREELKLYSNQQLSWLRWLATGFSLWRPRFDSGQVSVVDKLTVGQVCLWILEFLSPNIIPLICCVYSSAILQDRDRWWAVVNAVMNLRVP
jgi:hypothetical protein